MNVRKKLMAGAAILALLMNAPQVKADDIVVFGGEFEDNVPAPKKVTKPEPTRELPPPIEQPKPVEQPKPIEQPKPVEQPAPPPEEKPEIVEPQDKPPIQPLEQPAEPEESAQVEQPQDAVANQPEEPPADEPIFEELNPLPEQQPAEQPAPPVDEPISNAQIDEPTQIEEPAQIEEPPIEPLPPAEEFERPFEKPSQISSQEPIIIVPPTPQQPLPEVPQYQSPTPAEPEPEQPSKPARIKSPSRKVQPQQNLKTLKPRFMKLAVDDTYTYYLDKNSVQWKKMPYSTSEYIADVWIRMVEREPKELDDYMTSYGADNFNAEISLAREQGYQYSPEDVNVLRSQSYVLEHYYLRPKTKQIQFLCELEVFGRPQNTVSERAYDYRNWENLVPGSVESVIYEATIKVIGTWKSTERGHMTFSDALDEYLRISL